MENLEAKFEQVTIKSDGFLADDITQKGMRDKHDDVPLKLCGFAFMDSTGKPKR